MSDVICVSCNDTGLNSKGAICHPCDRAGRQPLRSRVLEAVSIAFSRAYDENRLPSRNEVNDAITWAYTPKVEYFVVVKQTDGTSVVMYGPSQDITEMLACKPWEDPHPGARYAIFEKIRGRMGDKPKRRPVAKAKGNKWVRRPS